MTLGRGVMAGVAVAAAAATSGCGFSDAFRRAFAPPVSWVDGRREGVVGATSVRVTDPSVRQIAIIYEGPAREPYIDGVIDTAVGGQWLVRAPSRLIEGDYAVKATAGARSIIVVRELDGGQTITLYDWPQHSMDFFAAAFLAEIDRTEVRWPYRDPRFFPPASFTDQPQPLASRSMTPAELAEWARVSQAIGYSQPTPDAHGIIVATPPPGWPERISPSAFAAALAPPPEPHRALVAPQVP